MTDNRPVEKIYQKKTQLEHILLRPDTYIGSIEQQRDKLWIFDKEKDSLELREIAYVPGLFKIFDEIIVNAADNYQRDTSMSYIKVTIDQEKNQITVKNNGSGIPIQIHKEYGIYIPELIFGNLLTSSNYDDTDKKVVGGRNGYGAKLTNIFSKVFIIETADSKSKKFYRQTFKNNMTNKSAPEISNNKNEDYTCITFEPDLQKFKMTNLDNDIVSLMIKRVYDMAGITNTKVNVYLNDKKLEIKNFFSYVDMYLSTSSKDEEREILKVSEKPHDRWEIAVGLSDGQFQQVSYVNSIATSKGGTHVNYVSEMVTTHVLEALKKKNKNINIKTHQIKQHLWIFVNCLIDNPTFDSQTKEYMTLKAGSFGSSFNLSEKFLKEILKTGILDHCLSFAKLREDLKITKHLNAGGKKSGRLLGIPKLEDANKAGTKNSQDCILILTEGDSAKSMAMAGIEIVGRDNYGVFPLRGKLLNVREASTTQILNNEEIQNIIKIIGLSVSRQYEDVKNLRYGSIMIMTDQDHDGSHIKGLIINFIHHYWPSLIKLNGFLKEFITPIIKAINGKTVKMFYTIPEYKSWVESIGNNTKNWKIKYYKGLGTSTDKEAQEYFSEINRNKIVFEYNDEMDDSAIDLAFNKKRAEDRKNWLANYDPESDLQEANYSKISYKDFINKEFILFSQTDNARSIPSVCDGLKPSERKILYSCFKRKLKEEIKVAQLAGYISEHSAYHHGEMSLYATIVAMAQNYVGSNNINLLLPNGQFGTRNLGGKDHASARYIFTNLSKTTRHLFNPNDDALMKYNVEEGQKIEPTFYLPIIPMILVNGADGIGTGWSTNIPCFDPREIVDNIKTRITKGTFFEMKPWYKGYHGEILRNEKSDKNGYIITGKWEWINDNTVVITELPIKKWTKDFKENLEKLMGVQYPSKESKDKKKKKNDDDDDKKEKFEPIVADFREYHTNNRVHFEITFIDEFAEIYKDNEDKFIKKFKLQTTMLLTNMVLFNSENKLRRYHKVEEILEEFYNIRLEYYAKRKNYIIRNLKKELQILQNKVRFILAVTSEPPLMKINKVKRKDIIVELIKQKYTPMSQMTTNEGDEKSKKNNIKLDETQNENDNENRDDEDDDSGLPVPAKEYDYLLSMPLWALSQEKVNALLNQKESKQNEIFLLEKMKIEDIWINDMEEFLREVEQMEEEDRQIANDKLKKNNKKGVKAKKGKAKQTAIEDDENLSNKKPRKKNINVTETKEDKKVKKEDKEKPIKVYDEKMEKKDNKNVTEDLFKLTLKERLALKSKGKSGIDYDNTEIKMDVEMNIHENNIRRKLTDLDDLDDLIEDGPLPKFDVKTKNIVMNGNFSRKNMVINDEDSDRESSTNIDDKFKF